jgi:hypothetical protein
MSIYKKRTHHSVYRKIYKQHYGPIPKDETGRTYDIHHIDGNSLNNDPTNLVALSIRDHYELHKEQQDYGAARLIAIKMKLSPAEISELSSKAAKEVNQRRLADGSHHLLGGKIQGETSRERVKNGTHIFLDQDFRKLTSDLVRSRVENGTHPLAGNNHHQYDHTIYHFKNIVTDEEIMTTRNDLFRRYGLRRQGIMRIIKNIGTTHRGWTVLSS